MRRHLPVVLLLAVSALAGCGSSDKGPGVATAGDRPAAEASPTASADQREMGRKFAACMRENGVEMEDPVEGEGGGFGIRIRAGDGGQPLDPAKIQAAEAKCRQYMPNGGEPPKLDAAQVEQARQMARCMRENGVPDFPDPDPNGMTRINGDQLGVSPEVLEAAHRKCEAFMPRPGDRK